MKIYLLIQNYEADYDYGWDYSPYEIVRAYTNEEDAKQDKQLYEKERGGETWTEDDTFNCYFTIEETELVSERVNNEVC